MSKQVPLSVVIITYNEEKNIKDCLLSVQEVADEILVVDSFSTDGTAEICRALGVRFEQNPFEGHIQQKNHAMQQAKHDYVLSLDADERLSPTLTKSILAVKNNWTKDGYDFNRLNNYCGRWVKRSGWYPDCKIRLWDRRKGDWGGTNPHDIVLMNKAAQTGHLQGDLIHYTVRSVEQHINQINKFSTIKAGTLEHKSMAYLIFKFVFNPGFRFVKSYFIKLGILDGFHGLLIAIITAFGESLKYGKAILKRL